ncbi:SusD/RagB family nutrient-binding outer membrane lipoprotein, partial [Parabacteroides sp. OttesenSCG-928-G06]|nr:SusD/RagB family nutrient-binding outer membrane lipoprotein [Parabacteroides sp. OttesenSCG-928-G06]
AYKLFYHSMRLGDVPYSEALRGEEGILKPKYDTQEEVMKQVLNELEEASRLFNGAKNFSGDPVLGGNTAKWKKVTDAFRLKVLLYLSKKENHAELKVKERFRSIVQSGSLMESSDDNLQLVFSNKSGQIYPYNRQNSNHYYYCTVSSVIIDMLKAYNDYRLFYFAQPAKTQLDKGLASNDPEAYIGLDPVGDYSISQSLYSEGTYAAMGKRYTEVITGEPYIRVGYAEQNFILAEAVLRGWIDGDAEAYYNKGIEASMKFTDENTPDDAMYHQGMKITDKYIQEYLASDVIKLTGDFNQKLKQIISQKYLTYYMQHPYDAYFEYRRTGYPELPINPATNRNTEKDKMPVRWMYPTWEFDYNKENLEEAVNRQYGGVDDNNKIMWILQ